MAYAIDTADRRRRRALRAVTPLAALLVAALLIWQGSNAAFSATTDNTERHLGHGQPGPHQQWWRHGLLRQHRGVVHREQPQAR